MSPKRWLKKVVGLLLTHQNDCEPPLHFSDLSLAAKSTTFFGGFLNIPVGDDWGKAPIYSQGWTATHVASKVLALQEPQIEEAMPPLFGLRPGGSVRTPCLPHKFHARSARFSSAVWRIDRPISGPALAICSQATNSVIALFEDTMSAN